MKINADVPQTIFIVFILAVSALSQWSCVGERSESTLPEPSTSKIQAHEGDHESEEGIVRLSDGQVKEFGIETGPASSGILHIGIELPGEVVLNADRIAHVVPRVTGVVREVQKNLGDRVRQGEVMAVLESRELADSTASLLAARERLVLARNSFEREERVWQKKISPEQDYIEAKNRLAIAEIDVYAAEQMLLALGFSKEYIDQVSGTKDRNITLYKIHAPFEGTVMEKHISLGEVLKDDSSAFVIADLSTVWVNLDVQQSDLVRIRNGQRAVIGIGNESPHIAGRVSFLEPVATETNRTIHARIVVPNDNGMLRPGLFVNGRIIVDDVSVPVRVPTDALIMVDDDQCLFVKESEGFRPQPVKVGRSDTHGAEILEGLAPGQIIVMKGAFTLKSELRKPEAEHQH